MKLAALILALPLALSCAHAADAGSSAIAKLGEINGIALACQQPAISSQARNAVQTGAPKTRSNGEIFENATNVAFLDYSKGATCPSGPSLANRLADAEKSLSAAFTAQ